MYPEIEKPAAEGLYEKALAAAKRLSIDFLAQNRREDAVLALCRAAEILCSLNQPAKAHGFAQEALELAARSNLGPLAACGHAVSALAHLRLGEIKKAEGALDTALELFAGDGKNAQGAIIRLVGAEVSLAKEDYVEARAFARDALAGSDPDNPRVKSRALLLQAVAEERSDNSGGALELLREAEAELARSPSAEESWQVQAALAGALARTGQEKAAAACRKQASTIIERVAAALTAEARERFLDSPTVRSALYLPDAETDVFGPPPPASPGAPRAGEETTFIRLRPVLEVIKKINSELNLRKLITTILDTMIELCNAQRGLIVVFEDEDKFNIELSRNRERKDLRQEDMGLSRGILKLVRDRGQRLVTENAQHDPQLRLIDSVREHQLLSILCLPLRVKLRLVGAIYLDNPRVTGAFGPREIEIAEIMTDHAAVAIDNALLHDKSIHDELTGLYNHGHFEKRLETELSRCRRHRRPCSVLMIDIDDFKAVNDTYGHEAGNELLRSLPRLLTGAVRDMDTVARVQERDFAPLVARYGGDEFEIILPDADRDGAGKVAERILAALRDATFQYDGRDLKITFSIGSATFPDDASAHRPLMLKADEALYAAKRTGKNRYAACKP